MARAIIPKPLRLLEAGCLDPAPVTTSTIRWDDAATAWPGMAGKTVFTRC